MTVDHNTFNTQLADLADLDNLPTHLTDHATQCPTCAQRLELMRRIRHTAPTLAARPDQTSLATGVVARTRQRPRARTRLLAAAAAVAIVTAGVAGIIRTAQPRNEPDRLAAIAAEFRESDGIRFVYTTTVTFDVHELLDLPDTSVDGAEPLSTIIPACPDTGTPDPTPGVGLDLESIAGALAANDPCLALLVVSQTAQPAADAYMALATSLAHANAQLQAIDENEPESPLDAVVTDLYQQRLREQIQAANSALEQLRNSLDNLAETVAPLAVPTPTGPVSADGITNELVALHRSTTAATDAIIPASPTFTLTQTATGTWTPTQVELTGTTETDRSSQDFHSIRTDPLGLAVIVLGNPETLGAILNSAPPAYNETTTTAWLIPPDILTVHSPWKATATIHNDQLDHLRLQSTHATIRLAFAR